MAANPLCGKLSAVLELKCNVAKLHNMLSRESHQSSEACPGKITSLKLVEGEWGKVGCTMIRTYTVHNQVIVDKARVVILDDENYHYYYNVIEGPFMEFYTSMKIGYEASANGEGTSFHYSFEYEKENEDVPDPDSFFEYACGIFEEIDDYLIKE